MIPKYLKPGASILVRFGSEWRPGAVLERNASDIVASVRGQRIAVHSSVIRRDVRNLSGRTAV